MKSPVSALNAAPPLSPGPPLTDSEIAYLEIRKYLRKEKEKFVSALRQGVGVPLVGYHYI